MPDFLPEAAKNPLSSLSKQPLTPCPSPRASLRGEGNHGALVTLTSHRTPLRHTTLHSIPAWLEFYGVFGKSACRPAGDLKVKAASLHISHRDAPREGTRTATPLCCCRPGVLARRTVGISIGV